MIRLFTSLILVLSAALPAQSAPKTAAKALFGAERTPSAGAAKPFGSYAKGCLAGAVQLPETGPTWQAMRLSRNRRWAHPEMVAFLERLSKKARALGAKGLYIGDMSQPRGGPMLSGHRSHQTGLDADVWMMPAQDVRLSKKAREALSAISMRRSKGAFVNANWSRFQHQILKAAARDRRVARIFVFPGAKVQMCNDAKGDRRWLRKIRPWWGHYNHFHVRLRCPKDARGCVDQAPPPPGDGCTGAQKWVDDILNPPPPNPNAPPPRKRRDLTLSDLPAQCARVLSSR